MWGVPLTEWFDPTVGRTPDELYGFVERLPRNSRLNSAMAQDVELWKARMAATNGRAAKAKPSPPEGYDYSPEVEALGALFFQLQQIAYLIANQNTKKGKRKKFKGQQWPSPLSARELAAREERRWAFNHLEEIVRYEDDEVWRAQIEEHRQGGGD